MLRALTPAALTSASTVGGLFQFASMKGSVSQTLCGVRSGPSADRRCNAVRRLVITRSDPDLNYSFRIGSALLALSFKSLSQRAFAGVAAHWRVCP